MRQREFLLVQHVRPGRADIAVVIELADFGVEGDHDVMGDGRAVVAVVGLGLADAHARPVERAGIENFAPLFEARLDREEGDRNPFVQKRQDRLVLGDRIGLVFVARLVVRILVGLVLVPARQQFHRYRAVGPRLVQEFVTDERPRKLRHRLKIEAERIELDPAMRNERDLVGVLAAELHDLAVSHDVA